MTEDCDFWILHLPEYQGKSLILGGMTSEKKPSRKDAKKYNGVINEGKALWKPWYVFFNTKKEAMEFIK